uniref:Transforming acidic coiled-coil-containing protein C-terminal domain-containing protein n=1 Tax=Globodera rostochiensis TaxID=31243 RepID=A0A914H0H3_GLORO
MDESNSTLIASDRTTTLSLNSRSQLVNPTFSTPQQQQNNVINSDINTQTVVKRTRMRQQTVTMEGQMIANEVDLVFNRVQSIPNVDNPIEELKRHIQKFFIQKEAEWANKLNESREGVGEELALCKIKLKAAQAVAFKVETFTKQLTANAPTLLRHTSSNGSIVQGAEPVNNGMPTPYTNYRQTFSPDMMNDLISERDTLRDEIAQLENSYSDLFKRYEKMRENCVLLKNSEDELKNIVEEDAAKYERLMARYQELRESAADQLNQANLEIQRMSKQHDDNTLGLRCRLKMNDAQLQTLNKTIQGKDAEIGELKTMCEDLMKKKGIMDDEDEEEDEMSVKNGDFVYK